MKKLLITFIIGLLAQQIIQAQGTVYLSNLDQAFTINGMMASNGWMATDFYTGTNAGGLAGFRSISDDQCHW